jgi:hypothetical protein
METRRQTRTASVTPSASGSLASHATNPLLHEPAARELLSQMAHLQAQCRLCRLEPVRLQALSAAEREVGILMSEDGQGYVALATREALVVGSPVQVVRFGYAPGSMDGLYEVEHVRPGQRGDDQHEGYAVNILRALRTRH